MNILFINDNNPSPNAGGIERVTCLLKNKFNERGHSCALFCIANTLSNDLTWDWKIQATNYNSDDKIITAIFSHDIDIIVSNLANHKNIDYWLPKIAQFAPKSTKIISVFHMMPGFEAAKVDWIYIFYRLFHTSSKKEALYDATIRLTPKCLIHRSLRRKYKVISSYSDAVVLLTKSQIPLYQKIAGETKNNPLFTSISNMLSFEKSPIIPKKKQVVLAARLDERHKSIIRALKIWHDFEKKESLNDWSLIIAGEGKDKELLLKKAEQLGLKRCHFIGQCNDMQTLYSQSAITMVTSSTEGFSLAITEAMQCGCVPIVYNSFAAATDIIEDGKSGFLIKDGNRKQYVSTLINIASNDEEREKMSLNAVARAKTFEPDNIVTQWINLFETLKTPKRCQ